MSNTRKANIRFDMDNEMHRKAWLLLQGRDKNRFSSYSQTVVRALIKLLSEDTTDIAASNKSPEFLAEISETVERAAEKAIERTLPSFLAGYMTCAAGFNSLGIEVQQSPTNPIKASAVEENGEDATAWQKQMLYSKTRCLRCRLRYPFLTAKYCLRSLKMVLLTQMVCEIS